MPAQTHQSDPRILGRRTLEQDHRLLAARLTAGLSVLDVGCGTGAITAGIARAVGPRGVVAGIDRDASLLDIARREHGGLPNLRFESGDATTLAFEAEFDVVTAARTLQWIADAGLAIAGMARAVKPSGCVIVLDYNHQDNRWEPDPPGSFRVFYQAFLDWRAANGWDNRMADHLPDLFRAAGLIDIEVHEQHETAVHGDGRFPSQAVLWADVIQSLGPNVVAAGFLDSTLLDEAAGAYRAWIQSTLRRQTHDMKAVVGTRPAQPRRIT